MASATSATSSSLSRSRLTILLVTAIATACGIYYLQTSDSTEAPSTDSVEPGALHRSNAVHRRRGRNSTGVEDPSSTQPGENGGDSNVAAGAPVDGETLASESQYQTELNPQVLSPSELNGQNTVHLLFRVSEDATIRNAYVHRGSSCNGCGAVPIRGIRFRCANCADYDLCEGCEGQRPHITTHVFFKIRIPLGSLGPGQSQPVWYTGDPETKIKALPRELYAKLSGETGFDRPALDAYWEQWTYMANTEWRDDPDDLGLAMDRQTFQRCLLPVGSQKHAPPNLIFERMFAFYDTNRDELIGFSEFVNGIAYRKKKNKWQRIFRGYDIDDDGYVDRKDFLRIFRSYYVLHKLMQNDVLQSLESQQLSSLATYTLVNSRQPLSSAFGQEGGIPPGAVPRTGEGKIRQPNGDVDVASLEAMVGESGKDYGNRNDIFRQRIPRQGGWLYGRRGVPGRERGSGSAGRSQTQTAVEVAFANTLLHPPTSMEQVPGQLDALSSARQEEHDVTHQSGDSARHEDLLDTQLPRDSLDEDEDVVPKVYSEVGVFGVSSEELSHWPLNYVEREDLDAANIDPSVSIAAVPIQQRREVLAYAKARLQAKQLLHERWKRRQFYTDEEEGVSPPDDWDEEEDLLAHNDEVAEIKSDVYSRPGMHSRSSSKVRFAEDMDEFDTRSNPSTSSRSVPERWGGIEIPDAEKDAGKEILYQVTQQAFNELLDNFFKEKEDLAFEAAVYKESRELHRNEFYQPNFLKFAAGKEAEEKSRIHFVPPNQPEIHQDVNASSYNAELDGLREQPIENLLSSTGYTVEESDSDGDAEGSVPKTALSPPSTAFEVEKIDSIFANDSFNSQQFADVFLDATEKDPSAQQDHTTVRGPLLTSSYRDPTLPQFRPTSTDVSSVDTSAVIAEVPSQPPPTRHSNSSGKGVAFPSTDLSNDQLYRLWRCEKAANEAAHRGGWGRLSFEEFAEVIKKHAMEGKPEVNEMDYLGSWIDFCIP